MGTVKCSDCSGFGVVFTDIDNKDIEKCPKCNGKGRIHV